MHGFIFPLEGNKYYIEKSMEKKVEKPKEKKEFEFQSVITDLRSC